jgi:hypothetical protein
MELNDTCPSCLRDQLQPLNRTRTGRRIAAYTQSATPASRSKGPVQDDPWVTS